MKTELPVGKKHAVVVGADRKVVVSILELAKLVTDGANIALTDV